MKLSYDKSYYRYYEHHYAPFVSDVKDFADMKIEFDLSEPFLPFQQLMAVLPAASKNLLPKAYQVCSCVSLSHSGFLLISQCKHMYTISV